MLALHGLSYDGKIPVHVSLNHQALILVTTLALQNRLVEELLALDRYPILHDWALIELGVVEFGAHRLLVTFLALAKGVVHRSDTVAKLGSGLALNANSACIVQIALLEKTGTG